MIKLFLLNVSVNSHTSAASPSVSSPRGGWPRDLTCLGLTRHQPVNKLIFRYLFRDSLQKWRRSAVGVQSLAPRRSAPTRRHGAKRALISTREPSNLDAFITRITSTVRIIASSININFITSKVAFEHLRQFIKVSKRSMMKMPSNYVQGRQWVELSGFVLEQFNDLYLIYLSWVGVGYFCASNTRYNSIICRKKKMDWDVFSRDHYIGFEHGLNDITDELLFVSLLPRIVIFLHQAFSHWSLGLS